jgi:hypothetical protein
VAERELPTVDEMYQITTISNLNMAKPPVGMDHCSNLPQK